MDTQSNNSWCISGHKVSHSQTVFFLQVILVYIVVLASILNIALTDSDRQIWIILLSSAFGYLLPNPKLKNDRILSEFTQQYKQNEGSV